MAALLFEQGVHFRSHGDNASAMKAFTECLGHVEAGEHFSKLPECLRQVCVRETMKIGCEVIEIGVDFEMCVCVCV